LKAFLVLMKLLSLSQFYAPKFIESHYRRTSLATLRQLERLLRKKGKKTADVEFLKKCVIYHLTPVFLRFKLHRTKFQPKKSNANLENLKKFQGFLSRLKRKGVLGENVYNEIRPTVAVTRTLYGLPKVHKDYIPLRPILCSIGSFTYQCASWLSKSLSELRQHPSTAKGTFEFLRIIADHELDRNHIMCSFDVKVYSQTFLWISL